MREINGFYIEDIFVNHLSEERKLERLEIVMKKINEECAKISHKDIHILFVRRLIHEAMLLTYEGIKTWEADVTADEDKYTMEDILNDIRREDASIHERLCMIELYVERMPNTVYFREGLTATMSEKEPEADTELLEEMIKMVIIANGGRENRYYVTRQPKLCTAKEAYKVAVDNCQMCNCEIDHCVLNAINTYTHAVPFIKSYLREVHINNK